MMKLLKKLFFKIYNNLSDTFGFHLHGFISPIDLMLPVNGKITAAQFVVISRLLDIESIKKGEEHKWDIIFAKLHLGEMVFDEEKMIAQHSSFRDFVHLMDKYGWDNNISSVGVNENPMFFFHGTHRLAFMLLSNPYQTIPFKSYCNGWKWSNVDGQEYWGKRGLSKEDLSIILARHRELMNAVDKSLFFVIPTKCFNKEKFDENIKKYGIGIIIHGCYHIEIKSENLADLSISSKLLKVVKSNSVEIIRFSLNKSVSHINVFKKRIVIDSIEKFVKKLKMRNVYYTPTITEANELRIIFGRNMEQ